MLHFLSPIIRTYPDAHWLTIGDGGADAWLLRKFGIRSVTASSISDARLKKLQELRCLGGIEVRALNAECLELPNASYDFVICTQAYHHLHRPPVAFYEFMRVSRIGFVLIEPAECQSRLLDVLRTLSKVLLRRRRPVYDLFEPAGNYIYRLSERDVFRMLAAMQLPWFAVKTFNNFSSGWLATQNRNALLARSIFNAAVGVQDILCRCRLMSPGLTVIVVPNMNAVAGPLEPNLRAAGFRVMPIPKNPYTVSDSHQAGE